MEKGEMMNQAKKVYAVNKDTDRSWVEICDTSEPHVNGVGNPVARVVDDLLAGIMVDLLNGAIATPPGQVRNAPHPDTLRLNHLIEHDHCVVSAEVLDGSDKTVTIEELHFVFENCTGDVSPDQVRAAIDRSIAAVERFEQAA